jgi:hypothetical protein
MRRRLFFAVVMVAAIAGAPAIQAYLKLGAS